jgi:hypothetical protein
MPTGAGSGGIASVTTDATLTGAGTVASPLKVASPAFSPTLPTFIGFIAGQNNGNVTLTGSNISAGAITAGDFLLCCATHGTTAPVNPWGWNPIAIQQVIQFGGVSQHCSWFYRVATSLEPTSYAFGGSLSQAVLLDFRGAGAITTLPSINDNGTASTSAVIPACTTRYANQIVVASIANTPAAITPPAGYTNVSNVGFSSGNFYGLWIGYQTVASAGTIAAATVTITSNATGNMTFAIGQ